MTVQSQQIIEFIVHEIVRRPDVQITEDTALVSSGLVDSLALGEILMKLENITGLRIPAGKVQAEDMNTVNLMLATAERIGRPKY
jgi:acyl carrier protein